MIAYKPYIPSRKGIWLVASFVLCFVNTYAFYSIFNEMPSFLVRYLFIDTVSAVSYTLTFALVESVITSLVVLGIDMLLPHKVDHEQFVIRGFWISLFIFSLPFLISGYMPRQFGWACVILLVLAAVLIRAGKVRRFFYEVIDRLSILGGLILFVDVVAVIVVILYTLWG